MHRLYILTFLMVWAISPAQAKPLSLTEALRLAGDKDPMLEQTLAQSEALDAKSVADGQLADPKVKVAMQNFPVDGFSYTREGMTQVVAGISQAFPRGKTLGYKSKKTEAMSNVERARFEDQERQIKLKVQQIWFDLYYWQQADRTVEENKELLQKVIEATESAYSTGRQNTQDIIGAELELSILEDKSVDINRQIEMAQAALGKWIGQVSARRKVSEKFPELDKASSYEGIQQTLATHPKMIIANAMIDVGHQDVNIAREQYKPGFNVGLNYGLRNGQLANGDDRPDMVTALVTMDVPLFPKKRQDKTLSARKHQVASATFMRDDTLRTLNETLDREYANWSKLGKRVKHYETSVIKHSEANFEASLRAYQEDLTDFSSLMRAQVMELNTKLQWMKLRTDQAKALAQLIYLQGENK